MTEALMLLAAGFILGRIRWRRGCHEPRLLAPPRIGDVLYRSVEYRSSHVPPNSFGCICSEPQQAYNRTHRVPCRCTGYPTAPNAWAVAMPVPAAGVPSRR